ncbi:MAG: hypothetical protein ACE5FF_01490, partial [Saprospiraceae bacterium]
MTRTFKHFMLIGLILGFTACQSDPASSGDVRETAKNAAIEETTPEVLTTDKAEGKIVKVTKDYVVLDDQTIIHLPEIGSDT